VELSCGLKDRTYKEKWFAKGRAEGGNWIFFLSHAREGGIGVGAYIMIQ
jgi:hypothetical protein